MGSETIMGEQCDMGEAFHNAVGPYNISPPHVPVELNASQPHYYPVFPAHFFAVELDHRGKLSIRYACRLAETEKKRDGDQTFSVTRGSEVQSDQMMKAHIIEDIGRLGKG